ncbi:MAG: hypothetical protein ACJ8F7_19095 [Gemmataceae bacterium]
MLAVRFSFGAEEITAVGAVLLMIVLIALIVAKRRRPKFDTDAGLDEFLANFAPVPPAGTHRLTFEGQPVRIRLVVLAPAGRTAELLPSMAEGVLEAVVHGLGSAAQFDKPRVRVWPPQLSQTGFAPKFFRHVRRPEAKDEPSKWILVAGPALAGPGVVLLGLALETAKPTRRGSAPIDEIRWPELLRIRMDD